MFSIYERTERELKEISKNKFIILREFSFIFLQTELTKLLLATFEPKQIILNTILLERQT